MSEEFRSLVVIAAIAAFVPLLVGLFRIRVAEVVLLLAGGVVFGPEVIGWITVDSSIELLSELGLGLLFFLAGLELEARAVRGESGKLAAIGWGVSLLLAAAFSFALSLSGAVHDTRNTPDISIVMGYISFSTIHFSSCFSTCHTKIFNQLYQWEFCF